MSNCSSSIVSGWVEATIGQIAQADWGNTSITKKSYTLSGVRAYSAAGQDGFLPDAEYSGPGVVLSAIGAQCGKCFYADGEWSAIKNTIVIQANKELVSNKYLYHLLNDQRQWHLSGSGQPFITLKTVREKSIPLAPFDEQIRIVAKIEELFSELDKGVESLTAVREQLKVYRQAVLKHAFEGGFTEDRQFEPKEDLGQIESAPSAVGDKAVLARSNGTWAWRRLGDIAEISGGLTKNPKRTKLGRSMKYLRVANVYSDRLDLNDISEIGVTNEEFEKVLLKDGDLLIVEGNGSVDQIGRVAVWGSQIAEVGHQNHLIRVRLTSGMLPRFFLAFLMSPLGRDSIVKQASSTSGLHTLSISKVSGLQVPVPSTHEQKSILGAIDDALSNIDYLAQENDQALRRCLNLRQSIVKKAFSGQLVEQDANNEPASELLNRSKADRQSQKLTDRSKNHDRTSTR